MADSEANEQVAVILVANAVNDSAAKWGREPTVEKMPEEFRAVFEREIAVTGGRLVNPSGDGVAAILVSAVGAVRAATDAQERITALLEQLPDNRKLSVRAGVHFGAFIETADGDIEGEGAEVANLMERLARLGGVTVSRSVYESARSEMPDQFEFLGENEAEGIAEPVGTYRVEIGGPSGQGGAQDDAPLRKKRKLPLAALLRLVSSVFRFLKAVLWPWPAAAATLFLAISGIAAWQFGDASETGRPDGTVVVLLPVADSVEAEGCVARASRYWEAISPAGHLAVRDCLEGEVDSDPDHAEAWQWLANLYLDEYRFGLNSQPDSLDRAINAAARAVSLDADEEWARLFRLKSYFHRNAVDAFLAEAERGVSFNAEDSIFLADLGSYMIFAGETAYGYALIQKSLALTPEQPGWHQYSLVAYHYDRGEYEKALSVAGKIDMPEFYWSQMFLAAIYGQLGRNSEAREMADRLLAIYPDFAASFWANAEKWNVGMKQFLEGLRKAGLDIPEGPAVNG